MKVAARVCPLCGQPMELKGDFPGIDLPPGPLVLLLLLWRFRGNTVPFESLGSSREVLEQFVHTIRMALETADLPWFLENDRGVGYRIFRADAQMKQCADRCGRPRVARSVYCVMHRDRRRKRQLARMQKRRHLLSTLQTRPH